MGLLPFHVYHSREAYYYVVVMAFAAGMTLTTADLLARLRADGSLSVKQYGIWAAWTVLTCMTHMSAWGLAAACWLLMLGIGIRFLRFHARQRHVVCMAGVAVLVAAFMDRWVWRATAEIDRVSSGVGHLGGDFAWVAPRVLPFFTAGANAYGVMATGAIAIAAAYVLIKGRSGADSSDLVLESLTMVMAAGLVTVYAYVGAVGGGVAKLAYFSALLPVFLAWSVTILDCVASGVPARWAIALRIALPCLAVLLLARPAWMITQLDGKPVPYKKIREWLDTNLDPGSVVLVDRWFEPWNEMARYAPSKVFVTFTVPDEPYETYRQLRWPEVTQQAIEQDKAQAFIRLTRNFEDRDGLWTWPETYFSRRGKVVNEVGVWLRDTGFAPVEDFYVANQNRVVTEFFYDRREDVVARKRAAGKQDAVFFDESMRFVKTGPLGIFPIQTEQFMDWRLLEQAGTLEVYNLSDVKKTVRLKVQAVAPSGSKTVTGPGGQAFEFRQGQLQAWVTEPLVLAPGENTVEFTDARWAQDMKPLLIAAVDVVRD